MHSLLELVDIAVSVILRKFVFRCNSNDVATKSKACFIEGQSDYTNDLFKNASNIDLCVTCATVADIFIHIVLACF